MHELAVSIGNFFFRYRNAAFPVVLVGLYALAVPPHEVFGSERLEMAEDVLALAIALAGIGVRAATIGYAYIKRGGKRKRVYAATLVTEGMFGVCRNPLYLGNILICCGIFLMHGDAFVMAFGIAFYVAVYQCIVLAEESYLEANFSDAYRAYAADVPRWIPRLSRFRAATKDMQFDIRRVIFKDYTTIATTLTVLAVTQAYEYVVLPPSFAAANYYAFLGAVILMSAIFVLALSRVKKRISAVR
jgi:protein-S-isoprenylcysteine O-methyltransferase Ste14